MEARVPGGAPSPCGAAQRGAVRAAWCGHRWTFQRWHLPRAAPFVRCKSRSPSQRNDLLGTTGSGFRQRSVAVQAAISRRLGQQATRRWHHPLPPAGGRGRRRGRRPDAPGEHSRAATAAARRQPHAARSNRHPDPAGGGRRGRGRGGEPGWPAAAASLRRLPRRVVERPAGRAPRERQHRRTLRQRRGGPACRRRPEA
jgi:hypothetical protein